MQTSPATTEIHGMVQELEMPITVLKNYQDKLTNGGLTPDELTLLHESLSTLEEMIQMVDSLI